MYIQYDLAFISTLSSELVLQEHGEEWCAFLLRGAVIAWASSAQLGLYPNWQPSESPHWVNEVNWAPALPALWYVFPRKLVETRILRLPGWHSQPGLARMLRRHTSHMASYDKSGIGFQSQRTRECRWTTDTFFCKLHAKMKAAWKWQDEGLWEKPRGPSWLYGIDMYWWLSYSIIEEKHILPISGTHAANCQQPHSDRPIWQRFLPERSTENHHVVGHCSRLIAVQFPQSSMPTFCKASCESKLVASGLRVASLCVHKRMKAWAADDKVSGTGGVASDMPIFTMAAMGLSKEPQGFFPVAISIITQP